MRTICSGENNHLRCCRNDKGTVALDENSCISTNKRCYGEFSRQKLTSFAEISDLMKSTGSAAGAFDVLKSASGRYVPSRDEEGKW